MEEPIEVMLLLLKSKYVKFFNEVNSVPAREVIEFFAKYNLSKEVITLYVTESMLAIMLEPKSSSVRLVKPLKVDESIDEILLSYKYNIFKLVKLFKAVDEMEVILFWFK